MSRVLVLAAHPDDEMLGVGGTVLRHRAEGDEVTVLLCHACRIEPPEGVRWLGLDSGADLLPHIEHAVREAEPDIVYTHHGGDLNADHRAVHDAVMVACRPYAAPSVKSLRTFYTPSSTEWGSGFAPNLYVDVTGYMRDKLDALGSHYSAEMREEPHPRSEGSLLALATVWGSHAGYPFAEAFMVVRERW